MQAEQNYIEVVGTADFEEEIENFVAELRISARAAAGEVAISDVSGLRTQVIQRLRDSGMRPEELIEGGTLAWSPWFWKKKVGQEATHKIIVKCNELGRMMKALESLEELFTNQRHTLTVEMQSPEFKPDGLKKEKARRGAISSAKRKAESIAAEARVKLGPVLQIEELAGQTRRSGMYGDERWRGDVVAIAAAPAAGGAYPELSPATRETTLKFRVRYAITKLKR